MALGEGQQSMDNQQWMDFLNDWLREQQIRALRFGPKAEKPFDPRRKLPPQAVGSAPILPQPEMHRYVEGFRSVFRRRETRRNAEIYLLGLCSDLPHKNGETMEAAIPGAKQMDIFNFLVRAGWSPEALDEARVRQWIGERGYGGMPIHVIVDETSVLKQGKWSVGVTRQYLGCVGKVANGQVAVTLHGVWENDDLPLTGVLYLPRAWAEDPERRQLAKVPESVRFQTKPEIARALLDRVTGWGLEVAMVHADAGYGELGWMAELEARGWRYCVGVRGNFSVYLPREGLLPAPPAEPYSGRGRPRKPPQPERPLHTVDEIRAALDPAQWQRIGYRLGVDGALLEREFAALRVHGATREVCGSEVWLLLERPLNPQSDDPKQYVITAPPTTSLAELARLAHVRPRIERGSYENAKDAAGLADYQGRSWPGFHSHLSMVWLAMTWMARLRRPLPPPDDSGPHGPTSTPRDASVTSADALPPPTPAGDTTELRFADRPVRVRCAAPGPVDVLNLPRQAWESLQSVHRRFLEWCRIAVIHELLLLHRCPNLPLLTPALASP
jgi:SRSO17 transposase